MNVWISRNKPGKQTLLAAGCILAGLILAIGFRGFSTSGSNAMAGFSLGVLLLLIGVAALWTGSRQTVIIDPASKRITVEDSNHFGTKKRLIPFSDIVDIGIGYLGKRSNFVSCYYLVLHLKNGEEYPLFAPGRFFEGASERSTVTGWKQRLEELLAQ